MRQAEKTQPAPKIWFSCIIHHCRNYTPVKEEQACSVVKRFDPLVELEAMFVRALAAVTTILDT